ncbi:Nitroreductase [Evansella caseinilytica]|uniref:Nitroreductase n=1 Tax=Evansella caseinilytica TaxID=1503961 RepID=A0A1H3UD79_9BACI|nr:nitroreductase family protein [Evansella caseinilytica]SDZ60001.1 Nitroreductase [Evansella caseinilytica]
MHLEQLIRERRTIRKFNGIPVSENLVMQLMLKAEQLCPYEGEARWRYVYAGTPEAREKLADYLSEKIMGNKMTKLALGKLVESFHKRFMEVPANVIAIAKTDPVPGKNAEAYGRLCRILQNFQLLAWEQQLGMVWKTEPAPVLQNEQFYNRIGLNEDERFVGLLQIGYFDKAPKGRTRTPAERRWTAMESSSFGNV